MLGGWMLPSGCLFFTLKKPEAQRRLLGVVLQWPLLDGLWLLCGRSPYISNVVFLDICGGGRVLKLHSYIL